MPFLAPRIGNKIAYVTQIIDAGAIFGHFAGCLCSLRAVEMRLHM